MIVNANISNEFSWFSNNSRKPNQLPSETKNNGQKSPIGDSLALTKDAKANEPGKEAKKAKGELSEQEKKVVEELKKRDREVRAHEQAHLSAGGGLVRGGASYSYQVGPDGKQYAIGGEVQIDISPGSNPETTIRKMQQVRRAALAPAEPSGQDRAVASSASKIEAEAVRELQNQKMVEMQEKSKINLPNISNDNNNANINKNHIFSAYKQGHNASHANLAMEHYKKFDLSF